MATLPTPYWQSDDGRHVIYCADGISLLEPIAAKYGQLAIVTDPPYGIAEERYRPGQGGTIVGSGVAKRSALFEELEEWDKAIPTQDAFDSMLGFAQAHVIWGGNYFAHFLPPSMGWLFWDKLNDGKSYAGGELAWTSQWQALRVKRLRWDGMLRESRDRTLYVTTQKPIEIMEWSLSHVPDEYDLIVDPYCGSATTGVACVTQNKRFIGMEKIEKRCAIAVERMERELSQPHLPTLAPAQMKQEALL